VLMTGASMLSLMATSSLDRTQVRTDVVLLAFALQSCAWTMLQLEVSWCLIWDQVAAVPARANFAAHSHCAIVASCTARLPVSRARMLF
jgi:hypothetical protein